MMENHIYLDYNATTMMYPEIVDIYKEYSGFPLNPSSVHSFGRTAKSIINKARKQIGEILGLKDVLREYNITFTASGTEANCLVLSNFTDAEIFISAVEHSSVFAACSRYEKYNEVEVDKNGVVNLEQLEEKLANSGAENKLVSVMLANNETGIIHPLKEISSIAKKYSAKLHSDFIQGPGKLVLNDLSTLPDFITISGHKFGAPTGVGALISKAGNILKPMIVGGGQEKSLRAGTENVLAIAAMGKAAELTGENLEAKIKHMKQLRDYMEVELLKNNKDIVIVGRDAPRLPNTTMLITPGKTGETQVIAFDLKDIAISSGAACSSGKVSQSRILKSMGFDDSISSCSIRISLSPSTSKCEIDQFIKTYKELNN